VRYAKFGIAPQKKDLACAVQDAFQTPKKILPPLHNQTFIVPLQPKISQKIANNAPQTNR
jgi:hypothetical protein